MENSKIQIIEDNRDVDRNVDSRLFEAEVSQIKVNFEGWMAFHNAIGRPLHMRLLYWHIPDLTLVQTTSPSILWLRPLTWGEKHQIRPKSQDRSPPSNKDCPVSRLFYIYDWNNLVLVLRVASICWVTLILTNPDPSSQPRPYPWPLTLDPTRHRPSLETDSQYSH